MRYVLMLLLLTSCVPHWADYQPKLASKPKDMGKYETDRKFCLDDANHRSEHSNMFTNSDAWTNPHSMVDQCIASKGYDVVKVEHCC